MTPIPLEVSKEETAVADRARKFGLTLYPASTSALMDALFDDRPTPWYELEDEKGRRKACQRLADVTHILDALDSHRRTVGS